jgi:hypothetical protein
MFDDSLRLQENPHLMSLLSHYAQQADADRETWRSRLMQMDGVDAKRLSAPHGELIAFDWIELNTGQALSACYRITLHGLREYGRLQGVEVNEKPQEAQEAKPSTFPRKKKRRAETPEAVAVATSEESLVPAA